MAATNNERAALGLTFNAGQAQSPTLPTSEMVNGPSTSQEVRQRRRSSAPVPASSIISDVGAHHHHPHINNNHHNKEGAPHNSSSPLAASPHHRSAIPPPPSPRRHKSGVFMQRARAQSGGRPGGFGSSKSVGDLHGMGLAMTGVARMSASSPSLQPSRPDYRRGSVDTATADGSMLADGRLADEPLDDLDATSLDNSARYYHRLHASSRVPSPTRSNRSNASVSPSRRSTSPAAGYSRGGSPIYVRRNLTLPVAGSASTAGSALSATLSPNSRFLQQHLPPLFPLSSPESDIANPLAAPHPMVILTPTTQDWRELKQLSQLEGVPSSGSDTASSSSPSPPPPPAAEVVLKESLQDGKKEFPKGPDDDALGALRLSGGSPTSPSVIVPPLPVGWAPDNGEPRSQEQEASDLSLAELENFNTTLGLGPEGDRTSVPVRFNSIGRRDSLRIRERPPIDTDAPRTKTKRELERERLFRLVDQEIAEDGPQPSSRNSWGITEIGSSLSTPPLSNAEFGASPRRESPFSEVPLTPPIEDRSGEVIADKPQLRRPKPSPLHTEPLTQWSTGSASTLDPDDGRSPSPSPEDPAAAPPQDATPETESERFEAIRNYSRSVSTRRSLGSRVNSRAPSRRGSFEDSSVPSSPPRSPRRRDTNRVSLVAGRLLQPFPFPSMSPLTSLNKDSKSIPGSNVSSLQSFSPFRSTPAPEKITSLRPAPAIDLLRTQEGNVSHAPSTGVPSNCTTPSSDKTGGAGGHGIDDYVILKEAGKGAYGLVMRAKVKGANGEPVGEEVIIKYVIKSRILADCWKKHKVLGPIPVEIHVMDQLRHLIYHPPAKPYPWDPFRGRELVKESTLAPPGDDSRPDTPLSTNSNSSPAQRFLELELKQTPKRGHPNICELLDFFEDREFYYLVMPRYGSGLDLFDRVESEPAGLQPPEVRSLMGQLTSAVRFLHANGIVHRDIKDENVILDGDGRCQLIDFGSAAHWRPGKRWDTFSGTLHYASPEIMRGEMYGGKEQDVWALGTVAYVLLVGETPFAELPDEVLAGLVSGSRALEALEERCGGAHAAEGREADGGGSLGDAEDFVARCLELDMANRPTADLLLTHRFLIGDGGWVGRQGWVKEKA